MLYAGGNYAVLNPPQEEFAYVYGVHSGEQVGKLGQEFVYSRAALWRGGSETYVDMHPPGVWDMSILNDTFEGKQVGAARFGAQLEWHAGVWNGTPGSFVDLHPAVAQSFANGISKNQIVGSVQIGAVSEAALWNSFSPASFVNMHPPGKWDLSSAYAVHEGQQVGVVWGFAVDTNPVIWYGSPESASLLPTYGFAGSANDIFDTGEETRVVGWLDVDGTGDRHAVLWVRTNQLFAPLEYLLLRGRLVAGNLDSLVASDNNRLVLRPGPVLISSQSPIDVQISAVCSQENPTMLSFQVESQASSVSVQQEVWIRNYATGLLERMSSDMCTTTDSERRINITNSPENYISEEGTVSTTVRYRALGPVLLYPWQVRIDRVRWIQPGT
jgi:hypothetical protein